MSKSTALHHCRHAGASRDDARIGMGRKRGRRLYSACIYTHRAGTALFLGSAP